MSSIVVGDNEKVAIITGASQGIGASLEGLLRTSTP
jgi:short-subunit dehydrogenase